MSKDLYIKNLSPQTTEEDIRTLFSVAGKVTYLYLVVDKKTEQFLCCAYVKMSSEAEAREAINSLNEARFMNAYISVTEALPRPAAGSFRPTPEKKAARPPAPEKVNKTRDKSIAKGDWTAPAPAKKAAPRRKEGEEGRKGPSDWTSTPAGGKKPREKSIAASDWTVSPKKERPAFPPRRKEGEAVRKSPSDWTSAAGESSPPVRRKSSAPARSGPPRSTPVKKGPGPKRSK